MSAQGYFEAYCNEVAYVLTASDRSTIEQLTAVARLIWPGARTEWAGSLAKGTAITGADLDILVCTNTPVTTTERKSFAAEIRSRMSRDLRIGRHAVRIPAGTAEAGIDVAFDNAAFGSRARVDRAPWHERTARKQAVRAAKAWLRRGGLPKSSGWMIEELVLFRDAGGADRTGLEIFERVVQWLDESANASALESRLRPVAAPAWHPEWSQRLPGRLEAIRGAARQLRSSRNGPSTWQSKDDVARWMGVR